jgi:hypothetical protein
MAAGDTTIVTFNAGDTADAITKIEGMSIVSGDIIRTWQQNNSVFVAKIKTA